MTDSKADNPDTTKPATISMEDFAELVRRANAGDDEALAELRVPSVWQGSSP